MNTLTATASHLFATIKRWFIMRQRQPHITLRHGCYSIAETSRCHDASLAIEYAGSVIGLLLRIYAVTRATRLLSHLLSVVTFVDIITLRGWLLVNMLLLPVCRLPTLVIRRSVSYVNFITITTMSVTHWQRRLLPSREQTFIIRPLLLVAGEWRLFETAITHVNITLSIVTRHALATRRHHGATTYTGVYRWQAYV